MHTKEEILKQYSINGESVEVESISGKYLLIDPLYLQRIEAHQRAWKLKNRIDLIALEKGCFPYGGTLLGYLEKEDGSLRLDVTAIQHWRKFEDPEELRRAEEKLEAVFATDSGTFLIIDFENFPQILSEVKYDELVDSLEQLDSYIEKINTKLNNKGLGFMLAPGVGKGYDFEGSGTFQIKR